MIHTLTLGHCFPSLFPEDQNPTPCFLVMPSKLDSKLLLKSSWNRLFRQGKKKYILRLKNSPSYTIPLVIASQNSTLCPGLLWAIVGRTLNKILPCHRHNSLSISLKKRGSLVESVLYSLCAVQTGQRKYREWTERLVAWFLGSQRIVSLYPESTKHVPSNVTQSGFTMGVLKYWL